MASPLIVVPTYNERENVRPLARAVLTACPSAHVLFVDDNSPDGTGALLDELVRDDGRVHVLHRSHKRGLGQAYLAGFAWALARHYDFVVEMDADFSHDPADVPRLLEAAATADLALGSRYRGGIRVVDWPMHRLLLSRGASVYVQLVTGLPVADPTGGFKCFRRAVLEAIPLDEIRSNGYSFQIETTHEAWMRGFEIAEVPITFVERRSGASKMTRAIVYEAVGVVWKMLARHGFRRSPSRRHPDSVAATAGGAEGHLHRSP